MVLPLLGILGLGAALAAKPRYEAWAEDTAARRRAQRAQGLDPGMLGGLLGRGEDPEPFQQDFRDPSGLLNQAVTPFDYNAEQIRSGLLAPEALTDTHGLANIQGGYGLAQQDLSNAGAWDRAVLGETGAMDRLRYGEGQAMDRLVYDTQNRPVEPVEPAQPLFKFGGNPQAFATEVDKYNRYDQAIASGDEAWRYVNDTMLEGAVWNNATRERLSAQLRTSALPAIAQDIMQAGAMSDEERPVFEKLAAVDLQGWGDNQVRAALEALMDRAQEMQTSRFGTFVNSDIGGGASGEALAARLGAFGIRPPRQTRFYRRRRAEDELEDVPEERRR